MMMLLSYAFAVGCTASVEVNQKPIPKDEEIESGKEMHSEIYKAPFKKANHAYINDISSGDN